MEAWLAEACWLGPGSLRPDRITARISTTLLQLARSGIKKRRQRQIQQEASKKNEATDPGTDLETRV